MKTDVYIAFVTRKAAETFAEDTRKRVGIVVHVDGCSASWDRLAERRQTITAEMIGGKR